MKKSFVTSLALLALLVVGQSASAQCGGCGGRSARPARVGLFHRGGQPVNVAAQPACVSGVQPTYANQGYAPTYYVPHGPVPYQMPQQPYYPPVAQQPAAFSPVGAVSLPMSGCANGQCGAGARRWGF